jgi:hypothetical protein
MLGERLWRIAGEAAHSASESLGRALGPSKRLIRGSGVDQSEGPGRFRGRRGFPNLATGKRLCG